MSDAALTDRRKSPRFAMALTCTLRQRASSPIWAETIDVGEGGMSVRAARPLQPDEVVEFDLASDDDEHVTGRARVTRLHSPRVYGLRFEPLGQPMRDLLHHLVQRD
jgi:hypothetical protein